MSGKFGTSMFIGVYFCLKYIYKWGEIFSEKKVYSNITDFDASKKKKRNQHEMKWKKSWQQEFITYSSAKANCVFFSIK